MDYLTQGSRANENEHFYKIKTFGQWIQNLLQIEMNY